MLLQLLDEGQLTDGHGRTVDFRNTLILLTSNLGAETLLSVPEGKQVDTVRDKVMEEVQAAFRPEFLNRLESVLLFQRLDRRDMARIVDIQLVRLQDRLAERQMTLSLTEAARHWLADEGYDPHYGARPLKRVLQRQIQNPLAEKMLAGEFADGDQIIIDVSDLESGLLLQKSEIQAVAV